MQHRDFQSNYKENFLDWWNNITLVRKPIVAAVNGYALGGGCEVIIDFDDDRWQKLANTKIYTHVGEFPYLYMRTPNIRTCVLQTRGVSIEAALNDELFKLCIGFDD